MTKETKRDVFDDLVEQHQNYITTVIGDYGVNDKAIEGWNERYDAALPDDLPVIPEAVGEWLRNCKRQGLLITRAMSGRGGNINEVMPIEVVHWIAGSQSRHDTFARAWVLEAWQVEETGEVVRI
ncbi:DUF1642 domain-containing protein [Lacticaseibacillus chiayiensis]|uniref:DUF1642 domain-containing protein n=1 Tax=Lacticaseibacillus chiayiensis TaxID=2100821 RepID=UPI003C772DCB